MLSVLLIVLSSAITIYMAIIFNKIWSLTWMFSWLICAAFELIVGQRSLFTGSLGLAST